MRYAQPLSQNAHVVLCCVMSIQLGGGVGVGIHKREARYSSTGSCIEGWILRTLRAIGISVLVGIMLKAGCGQCWKLQSQRELRPSVGFHQCYAPPNKTRRTCLWSEGSLRSRCHPAHFCCVGCLVKVRIFSPLPVLFANGDKRMIVAYIYMVPCSFKRTCVLRLSELPCVLVAVTCGALCPVRLRGRAVYIYAIYTR